MNQPSDGSPSRNPSLPGHHGKAGSSGPGATIVSELFRTAVEAAPNGMLAVDQNGALVLVNHQIEEMFGYSREELEGRSVECLLPESARGKHGGFRAAFFEHAEVRPMGAGRDLHGLRKDGTEFPLEIGLNPIDGPEGPLVLASVVDISERVKADELFRVAVEAAPNGMVAMDAEGMIVLANEEMEKLFGHTQSELMGKPIEMLLPERFRGEHPKHRAAFSRKPEARAMGHGRDLWGLRKDGTEFPVEIGLNPIRGGGRGLVLAAIIDISERKRNEEELRQSLQDLAAQKALTDRQAKRLQLANQDLEDFAYAASHDLKEPLRNLISYAQLLREDLPGDLPEEAEQDLRFISSAADRMQRLVGDLLSFSRAGKGALRKEEFALEDCVRESLEALGRSLAESEVSLTQDPLPTVSGDRRLLTQVYQNLLGNAVKFRRPGVAPNIHITVEEREQEWLLGVRDNGIGIAHKHASEIFAPFKRLHGVAEFEGTGVGLAICRKAVERHGGRIWVESEPGQGAHFRFTLPRVEA